MFTKKIGGHKTPAAPVAKPMKSQAGNAPGAMPMHTPPKKAGKMKGFKAPK